MIKYTILYILILCSAIIGAIVSKQAKLNNISYAYVVLASIFPGIIWTLMIKKTNSSLAMIGVLFDVIYALGYFLTFIILGEKINNIQFLGAIFAIIGIILLNK